jgi:O-glycosyl hydrolase
MYGSWDTGVGQDVSAQDIETMFNPDTGLGYNMLRMMVYPYHLGVDDEGLTWEDRIIGNQTYPNHDNSDWYDNIKTVNKYGGYVLASPWSPPKEWKTNDSINGGGTLRKEYYHDYALHLKNYSKLMSDRGAPIYAISIQNEPNFTASYDGCEWSNNDMRDFFIQEGHFTDGVPGYGGGRKIPAVLTMNGESANNTNINDPAIDNPMSNAAINLIGRHIYGNQQSRYAATKLNYSKEVWMTEHNVNSGTNTAYPNDSTWNYVWTFMNEVDLSIRLNDESAFIWWYAKRFYSMIGDGDFGTTDHAILPRGYGLSHYAKFAKETKRVDVTVTGKDASGGTVNVNNATYSPTSTVPKITAYESPDGNSISLVLFTPTSTAGVNGVNMGAVKIELPAGFIATSATAMRSTATIKAQTESVALSADGKSAAVSLPASTILSVKFTK